MLLLLLLAGGGHFCGARGVYKVVVVVAHSSLCSVTALCRGELVEPVHREPVRREPARSAARAGLSTGRSPGGRHSTYVLRPRRAPS